MAVPAVADSLLIWTERPGPWTVPRTWCILALLEQVAAAFAADPVIVVISDHDSIHHAHVVRDFVAAHPGVHLWNGLAIARAATG